MSEAVQQDSTGLLLAAAGGLVLAAAGAVWLLSGKREQQEDETMAKQRITILGPVWPIEPDRLLRVGESVLASRPGTGNPHYGVDLFARADSPVRSAVYGRVLRKVDGRGADPKKNEGLYRAGLFVDVQAKNGWIYRYLHLGSVRVSENEPVRAGDVLGTVSPAGASGVEHSAPHLHFEIRESDWNRELRRYGTPIDPLRVLPKLERVA